MKNKIYSVMVVHTCNMSYSAGGSSRIKVLGWLGQKFKTQLEKKNSSKKG
jgi:hypothetical protein